MWEGAHLRLSNRLHACQPTFLDASLLIHSKSAIYTCAWVSEPSPGPQGWYIQALAMWGNITSDATLTTRCGDFRSHEAITLILMR